MHQHLPLRLSLLYGLFLTCVVSFNFENARQQNNGSISQIAGKQPAAFIQHMTTDEFAHSQDPMWGKRTGKWIIICDDEESIRQALGQLLFDKGYQVTACADVNRTLRVASNKRKDSNGNTVDKVPDCIVTDIRMPGMNGLELLRIIRSDERLVEIPVVVLSAKAMTQDRISGYDAGADVYISKPFDPDELVSVIDNVIDRHETLNGANVQVSDLKRDLDEIKFLLLEKGGGGIGNGWVEQTNVFLAQDERKVLELVCEGFVTKEIAAKIFMSTRRVEQLLTRMFRKTGVKNRTELIRWAVSTGNVQL